MVGQPASHYIAAKKAVDKFEAGVADFFKLGKNGRLVIIHPPMLHRVAVLVRIQEHIAGSQINGKRVADAAQIDQMLVANLSVDRPMGVAAANQVGFANANDGQLRRFV